MDTSAIVATLVAGDRDHRQALAYLARRGVRFVFPLGTMSEVAYMLEARFVNRGLDGLLQAFERGVYTLDCGDQDVPRIRYLMGRYADFPLGYADATVIACAERLGAAIFTFDRRHFPVVAAEGTFSVVP